MEIVKLPVSHDWNQDIEAALGKAMTLDIKEIAVIGFDSSGEFVLVTSHLLKRDLLWLLERAKRDLMERTT